MFDITEKQTDLVKGYVKTRFRFITLDERLINELSELVNDDVISDIEETADWSDLADDEWVRDDVDIALVRVLLDRLAR